MRTLARRLALGWLGLLAAIALFGRLLASSADAGLVQQRLAHAGWGEWLTWWAIATQNTVGLVLGASLAAAALGTLLGASSVYGEGGVPGLLLRLVEFLGAIPGLILVGVLRLGDPSGGIIGLFATLTVLRTLEVTQLVRAHVLHTVPSDFVEASRALGGSRRWQLRVHVLPRLREPLAVNLLLGAVTLVGLEAALSFTGLGIPSRTPSWGRGLAAVSAGGGALAYFSVGASIGATAGALYGLAALLERGRRRAPGVARPSLAPLRELGAEGQGR